MASADPGRSIHADSTLRCRLPGIMAFLIVRPAAARSLSVFAPHSPGLSTGLGPGRRPKTKYEIGTNPAELTSVTTGAQSHFGPRIWLAGRRLMSMRADALRMVSAAAVTMISLRV